MAVRAAEVMGPVDSGERMIARNGERSVLSGNECISGQSSRLLSQ